MGILTEYNPDLALRIFSEYKKGKRKIDECVPEDIKAGRVYPFAKKGQRNYWLEGEVPLVITKGKQRLSKPIASIRVLEATHILLRGVPWTRGKYKVIEIFKNNDKRIHFNGFAKVSKS